MLIFLKIVWGFVAKYWQLLLGLSGGLALFLFSIRSKSTTVLDQTVQTKVEVDTKTKEDAAAAVAVQQVQQAEAQHAQQVQQTVTGEEKTEPNLVADTTATNDFLKQMGKDIRGG